MCHPRLQDMSWLPYVGRTRVYYEKVLESNLPFIRQEVTKFVEGSACVRRVRSLAEKGISAYSAASQILATRRDGTAVAGPLQ